MPLIKGKSPKAFEHNLKAEMHAGKPKDQSLAIAYSVKRKNKNKKASGGMVKSGSKDIDMAEGGDVEPYSKGSKRVYGTREHNDSPTGPTKYTNRNKSSDMSGGQRRGPEGYPRYQEQAQNEKGINTPVSGVTRFPGGKGTSEAGDLAKDRYAGKSILTEEAKEKHKEKLNEMRSMRGPNIKGLAKGGEVSASNEKRPMPDNKYDDSIMASHNSAKKALIDSDWTDNPTVRQAQKPSKTKLSRPKLVGSDAFSVRYKDEIQEDLERESSMPPSSPKDKPPKRDDEEKADRQGPKVSDMQDEHSTHRKPYAEGGAVGNQPDPQEDRPDKGWGRIIFKAKGGMIDDMKHSSKHDMEPSDSGIQEEERSDESDLQSSASPSEDEGAMRARHRNELMELQSSGNPDMEDQHNSGRKPYYMGGPAVVEDEPHEMYSDDKENEENVMDMNPAHDKHSEDGSGDQPESEEQEEHHDSVAAAIMARREKLHKEIDSGAHDEDEAAGYALGGEILEDNDDIHSHGSMDSDDSDQADLSRNADEDANEEDQSSFNSLRKENYSESEGLKQLDSPMDSGEHGDDEEDESENKHDMISSIRSKMNKQRQFR